jgi:hypothetical protein
MAEQMISARVNLNPYANKVLGILKLQLDLRDKSEALNKFIDLYGDEIIQREASDEYTKEIIEISNNHFENHGNKKMNQKELDNLFEK